jgi:FtsP/CotA-like multicopper oxidase with cupredoxin domain
MTPANSIFPDPTGRLPLKLPPFINSSTMNRKQFIKLGATGSAFAFIGGYSGLLSGCMKDENITSAGDYIPVTEGSFTTPLAFPNVLQSNFALTPQITTGGNFRNNTFSVYGYETGSILGPTFEFTKGQVVSIHVQNQLNDVSNVHWHGLSVPSAMDGQPHQLIQPGSFFPYSFTVNERAGLYWYHPHPHGDTARQVIMGLAGLIIVKDDEENALSLPSGERELFLVIQDKRISGNEISYAPSMNDVMTGFMGESVFVNGIYAPYHEVSTLQYRVRILNASNARVYDLALSNSKSFTVIGSDGGLLSSPQTVNSVLLAPGERLDLLVDFSGQNLNDEIFLISKIFDGGTAQGAQEFRIMKFVVNKIENDSYQVPSALSLMAPLPESLSVTSRNFDISNQGMDMSGGHMHGSHTINGLSYDESRIDETVAKNTVEIWTFDNSQGSEPHPMHLHGVQFQVLDRTGGRNALLPHETGWKDTVLVMPHEKVRVIIPFGNNTGSFVFHCHNLEHEDDGMMLQYEIT